MIPFIIGSIVLTILLAIAIVQLIKSRRTKPPRRHLVAVISIVTVGWAAMILAVGSAIAQLHPLA